LLKGLIHTVRDGTRVKVLSRWELYKDEHDGSLARPREINEGFVPPDPESAHLAEPTLLPAKKLMSRLVGPVKKHFFWLVTPALAIVMIFLLSWI
jgi:hypothetical protein